jgi:hypothetical protein
VCTSCNPMRSKSTSAYPDALPRATAAPPPRRSSVAPQGTITKDAPPRPLCDPEIVVTDQHRHATGNRRRVAPSSEPPGPPFCSIPPPLLRSSSSSICFAPPSLTSIRDWEQRMTRKEWRSVRGGLVGRQRSRHGVA